MPSNAHAQQHGEFAIDWPHAAICPRPADIEQEVQLLLGESGQPPAQWRFVVQLRSQQDAGLQLTLQVITPGSQRQRELQVSTCEQAARAAAVLIAVAIDPTVVPNGVETTPSPSTPTQTPPNATPTQTPLSSRGHGVATETAEHTGWGIGASIGFDIARLPQPTAELSLRVVTRHRPLRLELLASWLAPTHLDVPEREQATLDLWAASAATRACMLTNLWGARIGPCAVARVGWIAGSASGVDRSLPRHTWLLSSGLAGAIEWPLTEGLLLDLVWGGEVSLVRPTFQIRSSTASHTLPALSTQVGLGLLVVFG